MSKLKFDIALADKEAAAADREALHLSVFELGGEEYAAVRPSPGAFVLMLNLANHVQSKDVDKVVGVLQFLDQCFKESDLRAALIEAGGYEADEDDVDPDLSLAGVKLSLSNPRLYARLMDRDDDLGAETLARVMIGLIEEWSGDPTGLPSVSSTKPAARGGSSTARRSSTASTSRKSSSSRRRAS